MTASARHDLQLVRVAAVLRHPALHVGIVFLRAAASRAAGVNTTSAVRAASSVLPCSDAPACTITGWPCGERGDVQRAAHREMLALVVEHVHLRLVEEDAARLVAHEGVVLPAVPQPADHLDELRGALVALVVVGMWCRG